MTNPKTPTPSEITHTLAKISVSQILISTGFKSSKSSALDTLTRVTSLFLRHLTTSAASISQNPSLNDVFAAIQRLNFPLDFSIPSLTRFLVDSNVDGQTDCWRKRRLQVPSCLPAFPPIAKDNNNYNIDNVDVESDCLRKRGLEIPSWLPAFPQIGKDDDKHDNYNDEDGKGYWEERWRGREGGKIPALVVVKEKAVKKTKRGVKRDVIGFGRRERVKFRFGVNRKTKDGNVDDLEFRNGVCRGGKRICLMKRVDCNRFFEDDDDKE